MRFSCLILSLALLGVPGELQAARRKAAAKPRASAKVDAKSKKGSAPKVHIVKKGETAHVIAKQYGLELDELQALNPKVKLSKLALKQKLIVGAAKPAERERTPERATVPSRPEVEPTRELAARTPAHPAGPVAPLAGLPAVPSMKPTSLSRLERMLPTEVGVKPVITPAPGSLSGQLQPVLPPMEPLTEFTPVNPDLIDLLWPVETRTKSSLFGPRLATRTKVVKVKGKRKRIIKQRYSRAHKGIDLNAPHGTDVYAALDGKVVEVSFDRGGWGKFVTIDHGNGVRTLYGHNSQNLVAVGDIVRRGQKIALVGATGRATGPHVHLELIIDGNRINPEPFLNDTEEIPEDMVAHNDTLPKRASKR